MLQKSRKFLNTQVFTRNLAAVSNQQKTMEENDKMALKVNERLIALPIIS